MNSLPEFIRLTGLKLHGFVTNVTDWVGNIGLPAQMTLWIIRFAQETDARNGYGGGMCKELQSLALRQGLVRSPSNSLGDSRNNIFIDSQLPQTHTCGLPRKLRDSAQNVRHPNTDRYVAGPRAPDSMAQEVSHDPQTDW
jgi:hypothetical protein